MFGFKRVKIMKINSFKFSYSVGYAMYANEEYTLKNEGDKYIATVKKRGIPEENATKKEVDESFEQKLEELLKGYNVSAWDGFNKADKHVLDGNTFDLSIRMDENNHISASGYMKWPKKYKEFKMAVVEMFDELVTQE